MGRGGGGGSGHVDSMKHAFVETGLSWNKRLCCGSSGKYSSVVFHAGSETSFVLAHELAHK